MIANSQEATTELSTQVMIQYMYLYCHVKGTAQSRKQAMKITVLEGPEQISPLKV